MDTKQQGARLRTIRASLGYKGYEFAIVLGVRAPTLSKWETGDNEMPLSVVTLLQEKFRVNASYLVGSSDDRFLSGTSEDEVRTMAQRVLQDASAEREAFVQD